MIFASLDLNKKHLDKFLFSLEGIKSCRFDGVEICLWEDMNRFSAQIEEALSGEGLKSNIHGDLMRIEEGMENCEQKLQYSLQFKKSINALNLISHPIKPYTLNLNASKKLMGKFREEILLENVRGVRKAEIDFLDMPIVLDIGNLALNGEEEQISSYIKRVHWTHIHDYKNKIDHLPLGEGDLNLNEALKYLSKIGFTIELGSVFREWSQLKEGYKHSIDYLNNALISNESYGKNVRLMHLLNHIGKEKFGNVIDIGCGEGYLLHNIDAKVKKGYDLSPKQIFNDVLYIQQDICSPLAESADLAICSEVVEHLSNDLSLFRNMYNSLIPSGKIFLTTLNRNTSQDKSEVDEERGHLRRYGSELEGILQTCGFKAISFYPFRSEHYYNTNRNFGLYNLDEDVLQGSKNASGWVYFGVKE
ncbi:MAG: methyltransferase domain-containing protein [Nanoarchaeota archaeon]|nr:methyltransferase domain-containing protein [Nanoarchaeota archaeon]